MGAWQRWLYIWMLYNLLSQVQTWLGHKNGSEDFGREVFISDNETVEDYLLKKLYIIVTL